MSYNSQYGYKKQVTRLMAASSQLLAILMSKLRSSLGGAWEEPRRSLGAAWSEARVWLERYFCPLTANILPSLSEKASLSQREGFSLIAKSHFAIFVLLMLILGSGSVWGQEKVSDGIYYIRNNGTKKGYLWPSVTINNSTDYRYLTTSLATSAEAVEDNNGVTYPAHDKSYSHWVVKNVTGGYIQLINPRLNKYVVIRQFPKANNTKSNEYGDRDVWLADEASAETVDYTYFELNNASSPYII